MFTAYLPLTTWRLPARRTQLRRHMRWSCAADCSPVFIFAEITAFSDRHAEFAKLNTEVRTTWLLHAHTKVGLQLPSAQDTHVICISSARSHLARALSCKQL